MNRKKNSPKNEKKNYISNQVGGKMAINKYNNKVWTNTAGNLLIILVIIIEQSNGLFYSKQIPDDTNNKNCFCQLNDTIGDCSCTVNTVDYFNNNKINPRLKSLLVKDYFRFYKVNLNKDCPFWVTDNKCAMRFCSVSPCEDKDVPDGIKGQHSTEPPYFKYTQPVQQHQHQQQQQQHQQEPNKLTDCRTDLNAELSYLNTSISQNDKMGFARWANFDELEENFCVLDDHEEGAEYVDLLLNPERYTGYRGESAHKIWRSIYLENCFGGANRVKSLISSPYKGLCLEQRAFYRLISGLHSSINVHLCANFLQSEPSGFITPIGIWGRNKKEFWNRFSPENTNQEGPEWLKNLYFAYIIELRALAKAAPYLRNEKYFTGYDDEDKVVKKAVEDLLDVIETFPSHFNESRMFTGGYESLKLKAEFKEKFRNISKIMDCVGCDKCRLWGKLQIQGLGTALKILFPAKMNVGDFRRSTPPNNDKVDQNFRLRRNEIVSLVNAFGRLSNSITELEEFRKEQR